MVRFIRSLFAWKQTHIEGCWRYEFNSVTGQRRAVRVAKWYSPVDLDWLDQGNGHPIVDGRPAWRSAAGQIDGRYVRGG